MPKITEQYTAEQFIEKAKDNGWILSEADEKKFAKLYDMGTDYSGINNALEVVTERNVWFYEDRESGMQKLFYELMYESQRNERFDPVFKEYNRLEHTGLACTQKDIDEVYKKRFGTERPLSKKEQQQLADKKRMEDWKREQERIRLEEEEQKRLAEIARQKREAEEKARQEEAKKKAAIEEAKYNKYTAAEPANKEAFDAKFNLSEEEFLEKVQDLGWNYTNMGIGDVTGFRNLYEVARTSGDPDLHDLIAKILVTPVEEPGDREKMAIEIKAVQEKVIAKDYLPEDYHDNLSRNIKYYLKPVLNEKEREKANRNKKEREEKKAEKIKFEKATASFLEQAHSKGWATEDDKYLKNIYEVYYKSFRNGKSVLENSFKAAFDTQIDPEYPALSKETILNAYRKATLDSTNVSSILWNKQVNVLQPILKALKKPAADEKAKQKAIADKIRIEQEKKILAAVKEKFANEQNQAKQAKEDNDNLLPSTKKMHINAIKENNPLDVAEIRRQAKEVYDLIKGVDYNLLGQGSTEFNEMLEGVKALNEFAQEHSFKTANGLDAAKIAEFYDMQKTCIGRVNLYIARKQRQFDENPDRILAGRRQSHEQPRINAALTALEKLQCNYAYGKNAVVSLMREEFRTKMERMLIKEDSLRKRDVLKENDYNKLNEEQKKGAITEKEYANSLARSLDMLKNLNGALWNPKEGEISESIEEYVRRVYDYADPQRIAEVGASTKGKTRTALKTAYAMYKGGAVKPGDPAFKGGEKVSTNKLFLIYMEKNPGIDYKKNMTDLKPKEKAQEAKQNVANLKDQMLSPQMKEQIGFVEPHQPAANPAPGIHQ
jgi:hypothetical protein